MPGNFGLFWRLLGFLREMTLQNAKRDWDTWESEFDYKVMVLSSENYGPMALL